MCKAQACPKNTLHNTGNNYVGLAMTATVLSKIKSRFSLLVIDVRSAMEVHRIDVNDVREFLLTYFEGECSIPDVPNMRKIFESISSAKLWCYDHYGPLEELAEAFLPEDDMAVVHLSEYNSQLFGFYATTKIIDFIDLSQLDDPEEDKQPFSPKKYNQHYRKLTLELKLDRHVKFSELTLEYVHKLWIALKKKFNLPSLTAVIDKIVEGSIKVTYLVLPHIVKRIRSSCWTALDFFRLHKIIKISLCEDLITLYDEKWMVCLCMKVDWTHYSYFNLRLKLKVTSNITHYIEQCTYPALFNYAGEFHTSLSGQFWW